MTIATIIQTIHPLPSGAVSADARHPSSDSEAVATGLRWYLARYPKCG